ncbi:MAG: hypothetical protein ABF868_08435 [Sporolactobacillus sp.]
MRKTDENRTRGGGGRARALDQPPSAASRPPKATGHAVALKQHLI